MVMSSLPGAVPGTPCGCRERCFHRDHPELPQQRICRRDSPDYPSPRNITRPSREPRNVRQTFELDRPVTLICTESKRPAAWGFRLVLKLDDSSWPEPVYLTVHHGLGTRDKIMEYAEIRGWKVEEE